jgi:hypothetical protein
MDSKTRTIDDSYDELNDINRSIEIKMKSLGVKDLYEDKKRSSKIALPRLVSQIFLFIISFLFQKIIFFCS